MHLLNLFCSFCNCFSFWVWVLPVYNSSLLFLGFSFRLLGIGKGVSGRLSVGMLSYSPFVTCWECFFWQSKKNNTKKDERGKNFNWQSVSRQKGRIYTTYTSRHTLTHLAIVVYVTLLWIFIENSQNVCNRKAISSTN